MSQSHPAAPEPTEIAGRYEVVRKLGAGAFGTVYKARDKMLKRMVAIKTIRLEGLAASTASLQEMLDRFQREAEVAARLKHPNIVTIYDIGNSSGLSYLAMEFIDGPGLDRIIAEGGRMSVERAAALGAQVANALDYAHRLKCVHRDIKPANIMVEEGDHVKVTDFGIAKFTDSGEHLTMTGSLLGTPSYMSPEQARGAQLDGRSDLFSVGCLLYEMIAGRKAFRGDSITALLFKILTEEPPPLRELDTAIPEAMIQIVARALSKAPETRYQTGRELAEALLTLTRPGFVATLRQQEVPTEATTETPTVSAPPTLQATVSALPTLQVTKPSPTQPGTPPAGPPPLPTVVTKPPVAPPPPPVARPQRPPVSPPTRRTGGGAARLIGLGAGALGFILLAVLGGWYLLGRQPAPAPTPTETTATPTPGPASEPAQTVSEAPPTLVASVPATTSTPTSGTSSGSEAAARPAAGAPAPAGARPLAPTPAGGAPPPPSGGGSAPPPAAGEYAFLDDVPAGALDSRAAAEALAPKYRSGGSSDYGTSRRLRARERVPRNITLTERPAVGTLLHLMFAQGAYHKRSGRYGTFRQLAAAGALRLDVPFGEDSFERAGYRFSLTLESDGFRILAQPNAPTGRPFLADDTGLVREADE